MTFQTPEPQTTTGAAQAQPTGTCSTCIFWRGEGDYSTWRQCSLDGQQTEPQTTCGAQQEGGATDEIL